MRERSFMLAGAEEFRFGFQNQEMDDEIKGEGNSVNYKYRMHDPRLGRFFAIDPLTKKYPFYTPYSFSGNKVIHARELEGLEEYVINITVTEISKQVFNQLLNKNTAVKGVKVSAVLTYLKAEQRTPLKDANGNVIQGSENREVDVYVNGRLIDNHKIDQGTIYEHLRDEKFLSMNKSGGEQKQKTFKEAIESGNNVVKVDPNMGNTSRVKNTAEHPIYQISIFYGTDSSVNSGSSEAVEMDNLSTLIIQFPFLKLDINATTDRVGTDAANLKLSNQRAGKIMEGIYNSR